MMKKCLFVIVLLFAAINIYGKTIHWLTFIDTTDGNVGQIDMNSRNILYSRWIDIVNAVLKENGYNINPIDVYGQYTSPEYCKNVIGNLRCNPEDIIVFYYIGHGTENTGTSRFPLMLMAQNNVNKLVPLSWVHDVLKGKGARLTITIGMCCNAKQGVPGRVSPTFSANYGNTYIDQDMSACVKKMFLGYAGDLIITSASPNESSWACYSETLGPTDYFTMNLIDQFNNVLPNKANPNWDEMMREVKENVSDDVKNCTELQRKFPGSTQTPIWECNLVSSSAPPKTTQDRPKTTITARTIDKSEFMRIVNNTLAYISSTSVDEMERIGMVGKLKSAFVDNMYVRIMSQDGNVVVDKENINTFLGRIATSRLLMNVAVVDLDINQNGIITSLKVREIYKK